MTPDELVDLMLTLDPLADLPRTGWLQRGVVPCESIAAHSHGVAMVAMWLLDHAREADPECELDGEKVLRLAVLHDVAEALSGDIPGPLKSQGLREALAAAEDDAMGRLLPPAMLVSWREAAACESAEALLVKAADKLHMRIKALVYESRRGARLDEFFATKANQDPFIEAVDASIARRRRRVGS